MKHWSIGDICHSRFWIAFQRRPWRWSRWDVSFGPTYVGTIAGVYVGLPCGTILSHIREGKR